ncbi:30S ribosomal protein S14 [Streptomyces cynarae]|uniref:30S ribosomal protein S14 n=1 Tax=Streptomyces cynarae TaxID=2981134 RepID=A0ABY6EJI3_9ACTN|nr:30S ribosomal protein S14 [Streptomyces cynarae]UXY24703.1 30S ribosomal protein S14 [Streptomyces cynarae]
MRLPPARAGRDGRPGRRKSRPTVRKPLIRSTQPGHVQSTDGDGDRAAAQRELRRQPRDASATRLRNRDSVDGRPRGHLRAFGLSRIRVREMAHAGEVPGVTKSSW